jgi:hypothetical protein
MHFKKSKMLRHKRKRAAVVAVEEEAEAEWDADLVDDTMSVIQLLLNRNADAFGALATPPLVIWHQLYVPNRCSHHTLSALNTMLLPRQDTTFYQTARSSIKM